MGLDPKTADMFWRDWRRETELITIPCVGWGNEKEDLPAWSSSALLRLIENYTMQTVNNKVFIVRELGDTPWSVVSESYDYEVDACVDIVEKLIKYNVI